MSKVVVLGGGVAGMSAAHELIERGFEVEVYELKTIPGGKARSVEVPGTGQDGRPGYPGEHGFRFFPRFYKHVTDTMKRIPYAGNTHGVFDNLTGTTRIEMARFDAAPFVMSARFPRSLQDFMLILHDIFEDDLGITASDRNFFAERLWQIITSCQERRQHEYEKIDWWDFIGAENRSVAYQNFFGYGLTRSLVAAKANLASTKTVGDIFVQLMFDTIEPGMSCDRVLNGPTNDVWINPWLEYLQSKGVKYHLGARVTEIECNGEIITGAKVEQDGKSISVTGDYYIAAFPVEVMGRMLQAKPELIKADPDLAHVVTLSSNVSWMNGAQFYLKTDVPICHGHVLYLDAPWALTSVSQRQFWPHTDLSQYGDGTIQGILSVDISEWEKEGIVHGKMARDCTREEIRDEVWAQLKKSLNVNGQVLLRDEDLHSWNLDSDIVFPGEEEDVAPIASGSLSATTQSKQIQNREPLLVNLINTWVLRPKAYTRIPNLFLASDYVQTFTDLATMEGANEAARRAVNAIIDASDSPAEPCKLWNLHEPDIFAIFRGADLLRYKLGLPWHAPLGVGTEMLDEVAAHPESLADGAPAPVGAESANAPAEVTRG